MDPRALGPSSTSVPFWDTCLLREVISGLFHAPLEQSSDMSASQCTHSALFHSAVHNLEMASNLKQEGIQIVSLKRSQSSESITQRISANESLSFFHPFTLKPHPHLVFMLSDIHLAIPVSPDYMGVICTVNQCFRMTAFLSFHPNVQVWLFVRIRVRLSKQMGDAEHVNASSCGDRGLPTKSPSICL